MRSDVLKHDSEATLLAWIVRTLNVWKLALSGVMMRSDVLKHDSEATLFFGGGGQHLTHFLDWLKHITER
jgi:hypothetical protein